MAIGNKPLAIYSRKDTVDSDWHENNLKEGGTPEDVRILELKKTDEPPGKKGIVFPSQLQERIIILG